MESIRPGFLTVAQMVCNDLSFFNTKHQILCVAYVYYIDPINIYKQKCRQMDPSFHAILCVLVDLQMFFSSCKSQKWILGESLNGSQETQRPRPRTQMSNEKNLGWLGYIGDYITQLHRALSKEV